MQSKSTSTIWEASKSVQQPQGLLQLTGKNVVLLLFLAARWYAAVEGAKDLRNKKREKIRQCIRVEEREKEKYDEELKDIAQQPLASHLLHTTNSSSTWRRSRRRFL
ncbi:hypothetical protein OPV22_007120 [Ensete ventricosum]|uniref:Remorin C-terminal domain-containing protein n=1 Tax=Ensete ventricosum TaxID=4639 RepID=A0AAV8RR40_ENSVE|nr:hypothetical protein OPV22_007120 [Ensete ventricosum]